jgi:hypothetical protein
MNTGRDYGDRQDACPTVQGEGEAVPRLGKAGSALACEANKRALAYDIRRISLGCKSFTVTGRIKKVRDWLNVIDRFTIQIKSHL